MSKDLLSAQSIRQRLKDVEAQKYYKVGFLPDGVTPIDTHTYRRSKYGIIDSFGAPVELMYDHSLENLFPGSPLQAAVFVSDQFESMKRKFEELSDKGGSYGILEPQRALIRADELYDNYMAELLDAFVSEMHAANGHKVATFSDFCKHFISFIIHSRSARVMKGGLPISRSLFFASDHVPIHSSGLVIDFRTDKYNDAENILKEWIADVNYSLFCDSAAKSGFFIDQNFPFRLIANIASPKMQRAAEFRGSNFLPGTSGTIFQDFYLRVDLYDFIHLKNKLFSAYHEYSSNNPIIYRTIPCNSKVRVQEIRRQPMNLQHLVVPPIPRRKKSSVIDVLGPDAASAQFSPSVSYGLHDDRYGLEFITKLYIEVRYREIAEIKNFLTPREKRVIVRDVLKLLYQGDINGAYDKIGRQFNSYRMVIH